MDASTMDHLPLDVLVCFRRHLSYILGAEDAKREILIKYTGVDFRYLKLLSFVTDPTPKNLVKYALLFASPEEAASYRERFEDLVFGAPRLRGCLQQSFAIYRGFGDFETPRADWDLRMISSTSLSRQVGVDFSFNENAVAKIIVPVDAAFLYVGQLSKVFREREILLFPCRLKFLGDEGGLKTYACEHPLTYDRRGFRDALSSHGESFERKKRNAAERIRLQGVREMASEDKASKFIRFCDSLEPGVSVRLHAGNDDNRPMFLTATMEIVARSIEGFFDARVLSSDSEKIPVGTLGRIACSLDEYPQMRLSTDRTRFDYDVLEASTDWYAVAFG